jgi:cellobiose phosphorylase
LDFSAEQVGATGICKGLRADWNDCLNLGGGESAMVSFLHYSTISYVSYFYIDLDVRAMFIIKVILL